MKSPATATVLLLCACAGRPPTPGPSATRTAGPEATPAPVATANVPPPPPPSPSASAPPPGADAASSPAEPAWGAPLRVAPGCVVGRKAGAASLTEIMRARRCMVPQDKWIERYDLSAFHAAPDPNTLSVQRGAHADLFVIFENTAGRDAILQLEVGCPDDVVETSVYDANGKRIDELGNAPATVCMREVIHVLVRANDGASLRIPFVARKHAWGPHDLEPKDAGPLSAGTFELRLTLPVSDAKTLTLPLEVTR